MISNSQSHSCSFRLATLLLLAILGVMSGRHTFADDWPQWRGVHRNGVWAETGTLEKFPASGLKVRWRAPVSMGFSSPIVADGRVYQVDAELANPNATERIRCFDAGTGKPIWNHSIRTTYPARAFEPGNLGGPNATPIVQNGKLYTWGRRGDLICFQADTGKILWQKNLEKEYGIKQFLGTPSPLIEGALLILDMGHRPDASLIAFDKETGKEVWKGFDEAQMCSSPIVVEAGGRRQLIVWTQGSVISVDPTNGQPFWRERFNVGGTIGISTPIARGNLLLVAGLMLELDADKPAARVLWPKSRASTRRILSNTSTAAIIGDHVYSALSSGELVCLDLKTGEKVWETDKVTAPGRGSSIHITPNGDSAFLFTDTGDLVRAKLMPDGYQELTRTTLFKPNYVFEGRKVAWTYPAYSNKHIFARNNEELICASLETEK